VTGGDSYIPHTTTAGATGSYSYSGSSVFGSVFGSVAEQEAVQRDLLSAWAHVQRLLRRGGERAEALRRGIEARGADAVARGGCIACVDEAVELWSSLDADRSRSRVDPLALLLHRLSDSWEAEIPAALVQLLLAQTKDETPLRSRLGRLREMYAAAQLHPGVPG